MFFEKTLHICTAAKKRHSKRSLCNDHDNTPPFRFLILFFAIVINCFVVSLIRTYAAIISTATNNMNPAMEFTNKPKTISSVTDTPIKQPSLKENFKYLKSAKEITNHKIDESNVAIANPSLLFKTKYDATFNTKPTARTKASLMKYLFCCRFTLYKLTNKLLTMILNVLLPNNIKIIAFAA